MQGRGQKNLPTFHERTEIKKIALLLITVFVLAGCTSKKKKTGHEAHDSPKYYEQQSADQEESYPKNKDWPTDADAENLEEENES